MCVVLLGNVGTTAASGQEENGVRNSVVKIFTTFRAPDPMRPWLKQQSRDASGTGMVLEGERILTNAHVVQHAVQVQVQGYQSSDKIIAKVIAITPEMDLAVLTLDDPAFFEAHKPLALAEELPKAQESVSVYGYPTGGNDLSITKGIVSRIEFDVYNYLAFGLRIQVDAAINPGNSGGPALVGDKVIGLAFSKLGGADNIGYIIPAEEIRLFLEDIKDGTYDGKPKLLDEFVTLENPAIRAKLKLDRATTGVRVQVLGSTEPGYPLHEDDIVTKIGTYVIDNTGRVRLDGDRLINFTYLVQKISNGNKVPLTLLRGGETKEVEVPVGPEREAWLVPYLKGKYPSYFIYGPLVFSEATDEFMNILSRIPGSLQLLGFQGSPLAARFGERPAFAGERLVVVVHPMFTHPIGQGYSSPFMRVVSSVNGVRLKNLAHLVETLRDLKDEFVSFDFAGTRGVETIVFRREEALKATEDVLSDNGIRQESSEDLRDVWRGK
jgi:S1-C subfamily serine protease